MGREGTAQACANASIVTMTFQLSGGIGQENRRIHAVPPPNARRRSATQILATLACRMERAHLAATGLERCSYLLTPAH